MSLRTTLLVVLLSVCITDADAQSGCTDPIAINYNASATVNDGSCSYAATHYSPLLRAPFGSGISESSGVVWTDGKLWTHNDSGNPAEIYSIDTSSGAILQTVIVDNYPNTDWEDIAADSNYIYVGDFGNNNGTRTDLKILKIAKANISSAAVVHVNAQAISFSYSDQTSFVSSTFHNFDCEAMISVRDSLYLFTKDLADQQTRVYKLPKMAGNYAVSPYTSYNVNGYITGADYNPTTKEIVLVGYVGIFTNSFLWFLYDYQGDLFFSGNKRRVEIGNGGFWQTEGVCYMPNNRFAVSCENAGGTPSSLFMGNRNLGVAAGVGGVGKVMDFRIYPNPSDGVVYVDGLSAGAAYLVYDVCGRVVMSGALDLGGGKIDMRHLKAGEYFVMVGGERGTERAKVYRR